MKYLYQYQKNKLNEIKDIILDLYADFIIARNDLRDVYKNPKKIQSYTKLIEERFHEFRYKLMIFLGMYKDLLNIYSHKHLSRKYTRFLMYIHYVY